MGVEERKAREFQRREEEILHAAMMLAASEEWQSVTIDHIAQRAEIGKGTVYKHFTSKDEVCARLVMDHGKSLISKLKSIDPAQEYVPRLKSVLRTIWRHNMEKKEIMALNMYCEVSEQSLNLSENFAAEFWRVKEVITSYMHALVQEGIGRGIIANQPIEYLMFSGWATLSGAMRLSQGQILEGFDADEAYLEYLLDYILKGMMNAQSSPVTG